MQKILPRLITEYHFDMYIISCSLTVPSEDDDIEHTRMYGMSD